MLARSGGFGNAVVGVALACVTACQFQARATTQGQGEQTSGADVPPQTGLQVSQTQVDTAATVVEAGCTAGAAEACNGIDDNCNGEIDEGCGYQSGDIQVTLSWNTDADLDLYVTDPAGETISFSHREAVSGGKLDHDARGKCRPEENNRIENAFWSTAPPKGEYKVEVHYYGECNSGAGATTSTLSISVGGQVIGTYNYTLSPAQRVTVATFTVS